MYTSLLDTNTPDGARHVWYVVVLADIIHTYVSKMMPWSSSREGEDVSQLRRCMSDVSLPSEGNSPLRLLAIRRTWKLYPRPPVAIQKHSGRHEARVIFGAEKEKVPAVFRLASVSRRRLKTIWYPRCQRAENPRGVTLMDAWVFFF